MLEGFLTCLPHLNEALCLVCCSGGGQGGVPGRETVPHDCGWRELWGEWLPGGGQQHAPPVSLGGWLHLKVMCGAGRPGHLPFHTGEAGRWTSVLYVWVKLE